MYIHIMQARPWSTDRLYPHPVVFGGGKPFFSGPRRPSVLLQGSLCRRRDSAHVRSCLDLQPCRRTASVRYVLRNAVLVSQLLGHAQLVQDRRADAGYGWLPGYHRDDARRLTRYSIYSERDRENRLGDERTKGRGRRPRDSPKHSSQLDEQAGNSAWLKQPRKQHRARTAIGQVSELSLEQSGSMRPENEGSSRAYRCSFQLSSILKSTT
jgi:hypothetical protein